MKTIDTLIIGAGISGLHAANSFQQHAPGTFLIIDKGRSPGGRLATRRIGKGTFDHGAQFFTARSQECQELVVQWQERGWIQPWFIEQYPRYIGKMGMNRLAKHLAEGLPINLECEVTRVSASEDGYEVEGINKSSQEPFLWQATTVIMTSPLPQSMKLLDAGDYSLTNEQRGIINSVEYVPTIGILLKIHDDVTIPRGYLREPKQGIISWIGDNKQKGISSNSAITVHLDHDWSKRYFDKTDEQILEKALPFIREVVGGDWSIDEVQVKRWRYAKVERPLQKHFLDIGINHPLILAGDAFAGQEEVASTRVEHAILSGIRAGEYIAKR